MLKPHPDFFFFFFPFEFNSEIGSNWEASEQGLTSVIWTSGIKINRCLSGAIAVGDVENE